MKLKAPKSDNYCATIVKIKNIVPLENCDNIQATHIFGNQIIISKTTKIGEIGVYFPAETQLSHEYANANNLYRHSHLNRDKEARGYLEDNRRIKTVKFRQNQSCGLFMPIYSLDDFCETDLLKVDDSFDELDGVEICKKYVIKRRNQSGTANKKKGKKPIESKCIDGQFRFHVDTSQLGKNAHKIKHDDIISITWKIHGTSAVISKVLCKKKLNWFYKMLKWMKIKVVETEYDNIYSSRKVIKNDDMNFMKTHNHYYKEDIWGFANKELLEHLVDGMTIYAEIVGYTPDGVEIQKGYDYGYEVGKYGIYVYRITMTNTSGHVFEFSAKQVQDWCREHGVKPVQQVYYGTVDKLVGQYMEDSLYGKYRDLSDIEDESQFLIEMLKEMYLEKDSIFCKNKVPEEGIVVRVEQNMIEPYKLKSFRFLERESKMLDKGEADMEEDQSSTDDTDEITL